MLSRVILSICCANPAFWFFVSVRRVFLFFRWHSKLLFLLDLFSPHLFLLLQPLSPCPKTLRFHLYK